MRYAADMSHVTLLGDTADRTRDCEYEPGCGAGANGTHGVEIVDTKLLTEALCHPTNPVLVKGTVVD